MKKKNTQINVTLIQSNPWIAKTKENQPTNKETQNKQKNIRNKQQTK